MNNKIKTSCTGTELINFEKLIPIQKDNFADLSKENYEKLKNNIINHGFEFPFFVWKKNPKELYTIDGHQRLRVLSQMKKDGFEIPLLPAIFVTAKNKTEAKGKILRCIARFKTPNEEGFYEFLNEPDSILDFETIKLEVDNLGIDFERFELGYSETEPTEPTEPTENQIIFEFLPEDFKLLIGKLSVIKIKYHTPNEKLKNGLKLIKLING